MSNSQQAYVFHFMLDIFKHDIDVNTMHLQYIIEASEKQKEKYVLFTNY
jgi:hypothetical protein